MTSPAPYPPEPITPSNLPQDSEWSSTSIASRLSRGSVEGPFGDGPGLQHPPIDLEPEVVVERCPAACCWMTKEGITPPFPRPSGSMVERALVAGLHLERRVRDAEALAQQVGQLAAVGLGVAAGAHGHVGGERRACPR